MAFGGTQLATIQLASQNTGIAVTTTVLTSTQIAGTSFLSGPQGWSAYQLAQSQGFTGSLSDYLASLKGPKGDSIKGDQGVGVPAGGNAGQVLGKTSGSDYATAWITPTGNGAGTALTLQSPDGTLWTMSIDNQGHTIWTPSATTGGGTTTSNTFGTSFANFRF